MDLEESMLDVVRATMEAEATINALYDRAPRLSSGEDGKKVIKASVGRRGELEDLSINFEWERTYSANKIGDAIMEAVGDAYTNQLTAISKTRKPWSSPAVTQEDVEAFLVSQLDKFEPSAFFKPSVSPVDAAEELIAIAENLRKNDYEPNRSEMNKSRQPVTVEKYTENWISGIRVDRSWAKGRTATGIASAVLRAAKAARPEKSYLDTERLEGMLAMLHWIEKEGTNFGETSRT